MNDGQYTPSNSDWTAAMQAIGAKPGVPGTYYFTVKAAYKNTKDTPPHLPVLSAPYVVSSLSFWLTPGIINFDFSQPGASGRGYDAVVRFTSFWALNTLWATRSSSCRRPCRIISPRTEPRLTLPICHRTRRSASADVALAGRVFL